MTRIDETQHRLLEWTIGQHSERLATQVLAVLGYQDIDPSHPYGGKDGGRDIKCTKSGKDWIGAVYFPRGQQTFAKIKKKLTEDLASASKHNPHGVVFVTNQELILSERDTLAELGGDVEIDIVHMERIGFVLDQPHMHSVRKQYLDIETGPPPLDIRLVIEGAAHYFVDGHILRDHVIAMEEDDIRSRATAAQNLSEVELEQLRQLARTMRQPEPSDPPTEEQVEAAIAKVRRTIESNWARSEEWLGIRAWDGLKFTVTNTAASFLTNVELVITIRGARGFEKEYDTEHLLEKLANPDYEPNDPYAPQPPVRIPRPSNREVRSENVGNDLRITITLNPLRPQPSSWVSEDDEVVVIVPPGSYPIEVTWYATAAGYGSAFYGKTIELPVDGAAVGEAFKRVADGEN